MRTMIFVGFLKIFVRLLSENLGQLTDVGFGGGPAGDETADGVVAVGGAPVGELHLLL